MYIKPEHAHDDNPQSFKAHVESQVLDTLDPAHPSGIVIATNPDDEFPVYYSLCNLSPQEVIGLLEQTKALLVHTQLQRLLQDNGEAS